MEATSLATVITDIGTVLTGILGFIPEIFTAIFEIAILKYVLFSSIAVGLIYFVAKLVNKVRKRRI